VIKIAVNDTYTTKRSLGYLRYFKGLLSRILELPFIYEFNSRYLADQIVEEEGHLPIVFLPMETGGKIVGEPVVERLRDYVPVEVLPVRRNRKKGIVVSPTMNELKDTIEKMKIKYGNEKIIGTGYDDIFGTGLDGMILYNFLRTYKDETGLYKIIMATYLDIPNVADYRCLVGTHEPKKDKDEFLKSFQEEGKIPILGRPRSRPKSKVDLIELTGLFGEPATEELFR
jgi:hypothetical protein